MRRLREIAHGVLVATAELYTTTSTVVTDGAGGCLVIDPAVSVAEVTGLAADLAAAGLRPRAGFATHPHWDHLLWSAGLGDVPRYAAPLAVAAAERHRHDLVAEVQGSAPGHDLELFGRVVPLPGDVIGWDSIGWDGPAAQVLVHDAHAPGHGAVFLPGTGVLVAGDMLSDLEIPLLDTEAADPLGDYRTGLERLAGLAGVSLLVPGHGHLGNAAELRRRVDADRRYLDRLAAGRPFDDPRAAGGWLRDWHRHQLDDVARRAAGRQP
jgi:hydroxyacylglutathione hydrolase